MQFEEGPQGALEPAPAARQGRFLRLSLSLVMAPSDSHASEIEKLRAELALVKAKQQGSYPGPVEKGIRGMGKGMGEGMWRVDAALVSSTPAAGKSANPLGRGEEDSNPALESELQSLRALGNHLRSYPDKMSKEEGSVRIAWICFLAVLSCDCSVPAGGRGWLGKRR